MILNKIGPDIDRPAWDKIFHKSRSVVLPETDRWDIVTAVSLSMTSAWGVACLGALHAAGKDGDIRNDHAHIIFSTRRYEKNRFTSKTRKLDQLATGPSEILWLRRIISDAIRAKLRDVGRVQEMPLWDCRSYREAGLDMVPTTHRGKKARIAARRSLKEAANGLSKTCDRGPSELDPFAVPTSAELAFKLSQILARGPKEMAKKATLSADELEQKLAASQAKRTNKQYHPRR